MTLFRQLEEWGIKLIKKIKDSLFAKVFVITTFFLLCACLLVFGLLAWIMPQTYSSKLNDVLDDRAKDFILELEQVSFQESGGLFDQLQNTEISYVELYADNGLQVSLPTLQEENGLNNGIIIAASEEDYSENVPILSNSYYFAFADSTDRYMLMVYGTAEQVAELQQSFFRILPLLLCVISVIALVASGLYAHIITKPVLKISRISEKMSDLHLEWRLREDRTDELGILEKSLNILSCNLSVALSDLQNANKKLEADIEHEKKIEQAQLDFFSAVSHELKTPITVIKGQLEGMLLGVGAYKDHKKYLSRSLEIVNILETLVQEILTVSRLETVNSELKSDKIDCVQLICQYLNETEDLTTNKDLQIHCDMPKAAYINGDKMLMKKVFSNLIGNAIIYSPQGAEIDIIAQVEEDQFLFSVENTGTNIPEDCISKLFDAFYRIDQSRSRKTGGSGLGLYITQKILQRHGSKCLVCNTSTGVRFSFVI